MDYEKISNVITFTIAFVFIFVIAICIFRSGTYGRRSNSLDERDSRIREGFNDSKRESGELAETIDSAGSHISRAKSILQRAISRSRKEKESVQDSNDSDKQ